MANSTSGLFAAITKNKMALASAFGVSSSKDKNHQQSNKDLKLNSQERVILPRTRLNENKRMFDEGIKFNRNGEYLNSSSSSSLFRPTMVSCESEQKHSIMVNSQKSIANKWCGPAYTHNDWLKQCLERRNNDKTLISTLSDISADLDTMASSEVNDEMKRMVHRIQVAVREDATNDLERCSQIAADMVYLQKNMKSLVPHGSVEKDEKAMWQEGRERREQNKKLLEESIKRNRDLQQLSTKTFPRTKY